MQFEWDRDRGRRNLKKHGVTFDEAVTSYVILSADRRCESSVPARPPRERGSVMRHKRQAQRDEMRPEYDFDYSKAVRGKYYRRLLKEDANVVVLEPDIAKAFRGSAAVNDALRSLLQVSESTRCLTSRSARTARKRAAG